ncbi:UNVERIFIED_ORG: hypothetical protein BDU10_2557 [Burkholderia sp. CF145]
MDLQKFESVLRDKESPTAGELGGLSAIHELANQFVGSGHADRLVDVLIRSGDESRQELLEFASRVLRENQFPMVVAAVGQTVATVAMSRLEARSLQDVLLDRARRTDSPLDNHMASECLAAALLLASDGNAPKAALVAALERVEPGGDSMLVSRAALLAGLAWHWDRLNDLETLLERLASDPQAGEQAAFELGMIHIDRALCSQDKETLFASLRDAAKWFTAATEMDPDMSEARALSGTVSALLLFCEEAPADKVEYHVTQACEVVGERLQFVDSRSLRKWLRPRLDAQAAWYELTCALRGLSKHMSERSWLRALPVLQQIANLRSTLVTLATESGDALRDAVTNRLASGFVAREGLRAHLQVWIDDPLTDEMHKQQAVELMTAVDALRDDPGKAMPLASEGQLASGTEPETLPSNSALGFLSRMRRKPFNRMEEECFLKLISQLRPHVDFRGSVETDVSALIVFLIQFTTLCLNVSSDNAGPAFQFLFEPDGNLPLEKELQIAMFHSMHFSVSGFQSHQIHTEAHDISRGRVDIAISCVEWMMKLELKREKSNASKEGISKYLGQAGSYLLTGARIGFLVVLDLCYQKEWPLTLDDNCWVEAVKGPGDSEPRLIVVFRIPGIRPVPSSIRTPAVQTEAVAKRPGKRGVKADKAAGK